MIVVGPKDLPVINGMFNDLKAGSEPTLVWAIYLSRLFTGDINTVNVELSKRIVYWELMSECIYFIEHGIFTVPPLNWMDSINGGSDDVICDVEKMCQRSTLRYTDMLKRVFNQAPNDHRLVEKMNLRWIRHTHGTEYLVQLAYVLGQVPTGIQVPTPCNGP